MKTSRYFPWILGFLFFGRLLACPVFCPASEKDYWPAGSWRTSSPEGQGFDSAGLAKVFEFVNAHDTQIHSLLIIRNGFVVLDAYFFPYSKGVVHDLASITKSITSTLIGIAIDKGYIKAVSQPILAFFPAFTPANMDERKRRLTIEHLLTMTSGLCRDFPSGEAQLSQMRLTEDWAESMLDLPLVAEPGRQFAYCSGASQILSAIITRATGLNELAFAKKFLFGPLGIQDVYWPTDPKGNNTGWGDFFIKPPDLAKIGYLFLKKGQWRDQRVISRGWIEEATREHVAPDQGTGYGYRWWMPKDQPGLYEGRGRGGQRLSVWPQKNLVAVFTGSGFEPGDIGRIIRAALQSDRSLPENTAAHTILQAKIAEAGLPPPPKPVPPLPAAARLISGKIFVFEPNSAGLKLFALTFPGGSEARLRIAYADPLSRETGDNEPVVGLDGVYRISNASRFHLPMGARGYWVSETDFECTFDEAANNHIYRIRIHFGGDRADFKIVENTGTMEAALTARVQR